MTSAEFVRVEVNDHIATVTIDRPPVNAMNRQLYREIAETFRSFEDNRDVHVAVLASASERAFLAGADLRERFEGATREVVLDAGKAARDCFWAIYDCAVPVIAAVNGPALGAGLAVVACCDVIVASERAVFGLPEINVGLLGGGSHLLRLVGPYRMRQAFYTGERMPAEELYRLGAVAKVVPHDALLDEARALAAEIAAKSPIAVRLAKEALNRVEYLPLKEAYRTEQDYTARLRNFEDSAEAARAFLEKRPPRFQWR
jgi:enoyl-CoA hydratase